MLDEDSIKLIEDLKLWAECIGFSKEYSVPLEKFEEIFDYSASELRSKSLDTLQDYLIICLKYISNLQKIINELNTIVTYCETSIEYLLADKILSMSSLVSKYDIKLIKALEGSKLAKELFNIKNKTKLKLIIIDQQIETKKKFTDILGDIIKKKNYERSN